MDDQAKVLVTGARGMLGRAVLAAAPVPVHGVDLGDTDLSIEAEAADLLAGPWTGVIHCAGYTDVDGAEADPDAAERGNVEATRNVALGCAKFQLPLVVLSTDYVFDGKMARPYREDDAPHPLGVYARTKFEAERAALRAHPDSTRIVRTAWLYGAGGRNFPDTILALARAGTPLTVVDDQTGSPTHTEALAPALFDILRLGRSGIYHATCEGSTTWHGFAEAVLECAGEDVAVARCSTAEANRAAPRPANSVLDCSRLAALRGKRLPSWHDALVGYIEGR